MLPKLLWDQASTLETELFSELAPVPSGTYNLGSYIQATRRNHFGSASVFWTIHKHTLGDPEIFQWPI
ncbi:hypothetical protein XI03_32995 [Bradyrhizobium sp. CCBAU 65884]|nr:hypothetical protein [Bradyrhizobium sp. CCBAU 65884]